jgi:hypothetical protein
MKSKILEHDIGAGSVQAYFYRYGSAEAFAIEASLPPAHKRSRQIEALSNFVRPFKADERVCFVARGPEDVDPQSVAAIGRLVEELEPSWVRDVREACRHTNDLGVIAGECELELNAAAAIVSNLVAAGELPPLAGEAMD